MSPSTSDLLVNWQLAATGVFGGIGLVISIASVIKKQREQPEHWIHFLQKLLQVSFISITLVAALNLSLQVAINFPHFMLALHGEHASLAEQNTQNIIAELGETVGDVRDQLDGEFERERERREAAENRLHDEIDQLKDPIERLRRPIPPTLAQELIQTKEDGKMSGDELKRILRKHLTAGGLQIRFGCDARQPDRADLPYMDITLGPRPVETWRVLLTPEPEGWHVLVPSRD